MKRQGECRRTPTAAALLALLFTCHQSPAAPDPAADARANAKAAMNLALSELQQSAGPDQRVTARADILDEYLANPRLTGVWNSWEIKATAPPAATDYEKPAKDAKFLGWLVSAPDPAAARQVAYASQPLENPATLWGAGTLGATAPVSSYVSAAKVPVASPAGAYAWAVLDEGVKVRINTPYADGATTSAAKTLQLGSGERPGVEFIPGLGTLRRAYFRNDAAEFADFTKGIGDANFSLTAERLAPNTGGILKLLTHDISLHSLGLFTDTARGGLRQDFHLLTNTNNLPAAFSGTGVYASRLGINSVPSDPNWTSLLQLARLYREKIINAGGVPKITAQWPNGWAAATKSTGATKLDRKPPPGVLLLPTIAKVQMLMSLIGRDLYANLPPAPIYRPLTPAEKATGIHGPQDGNFRASKYDYDLHLLYAPIITLHNPYNVALEFSNLHVEFVNVPFTMTVYRGAQAQSTAPVLMETMTADNDSGARGKTFGLNLKTKKSDGTPGDTTFKLLPGEVKMFSPYINPNLDWTQRGSYWDIYLGDNKTTNMDAMPGWPGDAIGFDCNWLAGNKLIDQDYASGHWGGCLGLAWDDQIHVEFTPLSIPALSNNKFVINMSATGGNTGTPVIVSSIEFDYERPDGLQTFIGNNGVAMPMRYPKANAVPNYVLGADLVDRSTTQIKNIKFAKAFALLSMQAKSTSGGRDTGNIDGRLATKPWFFAHANIGASSQKVLTEHSANFSHEVDLQVLPGSPDDWIDHDSQDRNNFMSGHTGTNGTKFGVQYDIPLAPLQTLAGLNGANPGGSSGYLPRFAQPIGNSWAHPLMSPNNLLEAKSVSGYNFADHSFLLNLALYDSYYFSGLADQSGAFGTGKSTGTLAGGFAAGTPLDDPRLLLYRPNGKTAVAFAGEVAKPAAYATIASWQMMQGAFNINSTSVPAWKAMLASIHDAQAIYNQLIKSGTSPTSALTALTAPATGKTRISRFRLPAATSAADGGDRKDGYWLGPREYSDAQLQTLAENIVKQVRLRGPFLSLAEFVNRRLGTDETAQRGALQQAIDDSNLNQAIATAANAGYEIPASAVSTYQYANPAAGAGASYQGAPGYLSQADLLNVLGNAATARSDTFTIRGYGEAHDGAGTVTASAVCEAVVQRLPDWYDPVDLAETAPAYLLGDANKSLGRRFRLLAFRWLSPDEI